jgi:hypothetical protein
VGSSTAMHGEHDPGVDTQEISVLGDTPRTATPPERPPNLTPGVGLPIGRPVVRRPQQLRVHSALEDLGWTGQVGELNATVQAKRTLEQEAILISTSAAILAGFASWKLALLEARTEVHCIEYALNEDESLRFILKNHQPSPGWNPFLRIRLALTLESRLQQQAIDNMRIGGRCKGLAKLPDLKQMDVRREVASAAGVGVRNVSNVKTILQRAHPRVIQALTEGSLTINGAMKFCKLPRPEQLDEFIRDREDRAVDRVIREAVATADPGEACPNIGVVLRALQQKETEQPGSVEMRATRRQQTVILVGRDLLKEAATQREMKQT